ncbi:MAG TPA: ABC transporter permease [Ktedonobacteraceae bacterium]|jgi:osmoprotectant transport system permease protein
MKYLFNPYNYDLSDPESIPNLFLQHFYLVAIAMIISLIIAIPLGIFIARRPRWNAVIITIADFLYTIPGVALIGVLITIVHLSPLAILIPLICYTQLALLRNTAAAVRGVDPLLLEVGKAMGMDRWQVLWRVTLPLAMPVIIAGIRIATVTTIGIATLASLAGQGGLGDLVFNNITPYYPEAIIAGGILMALFAIVADLLLLALQITLNRGRSVVATA